MEINVTLVSVFVVILLFIPGFFFKRFYYSGQFTKQFGFGIFAERFITSVFWGIIIQCITLGATSKIFKITYNNIKSPLSSFYSQLINNNLPDFSDVNIKYGAVYMACTIVSAMFLGFVCHKVVRILRLDILIPPLKYTNDWYYYFRGDLLKHKTAAGIRAKVISTDIDIIAEDGRSGGGLYSGFLSHYTISQKTGELETIALTRTRRWSVSNNNFKDIPGDCIIIPYSKIINLNIRYNIKALRQPKLSVVLKTAGNAITWIIALVIPYMIIDRHSADIGAWRTLSAVIVAYVILFIGLVLITLTYMAVKKKMAKGAFAFGSILFLAVLYGLYRLFSLVLYYGRT